ncbi:MAG: energy transducer TonB [Firmicutes bacterium]|nr:energy transducer TonB [Bacillota bacterium]
MLFKKGPGFAWSLFFSLILHGLALLAADLFWNPVFPGKKDAGPGPVRLTVTIQEPAVAPAPISREAEPRQPQESPAPLRATDMQSLPEPVREPAILKEEKRAVAVVPAPVTPVFPLPGDDKGEKPAQAPADQDDGKAELSKRIIATEAAMATEKSGPETGTVSGEKINTATDGMGLTEKMGLTGETGLTGEAEAAGSDGAMPSGRAEITRPVAVNRKPPVYPQTARENNWEGNVLLDALILADGTVGDLRVERSSGYELLDAAALAAVKDWRYRPALKDNAPVACRIRINIRFVLEE